MSGESTLRQPRTIEVTVVRKQQYEAWYCREVPTAKPQRVNRVGIPRSQDSATVVGNTAPECLQNCIT